MPKSGGTSIHISPSQATASAIAAVQKFGDSGSLQGPAGFGMSLPQNYGGGMAMGSVPAYNQAPQWWQDPAAYGGYAGWRPPRPEDGAWYGRGGHIMLDGGSVQGPAGIDGGGGRGDVVHTPLRPNASEYGHALGGMHRSGLTGVTDYAPISTHAQPNTYDSGSVQGSPGYDGGGGGYAPRPGYLQGQVDNYPEGWQQPRMAPDSELWEADDTWGRDASGKAYGPNNPAPRRPVWGIDYMDQPHETGELILGDWQRLLDWNRQQEGGGDY